jgi:hypothetical protein
MAGQSRTKFSARHDGGTGEMMFQNFITVVMILVSMTIAASRTPARMMAQCQFRGL